jgi:hypothetical protein
MSCSHRETVRTVTPSAKGCEDCLKTGSPWVHLRLCRACGHVGCCDDSPNKHASAHFRETGHPVIEGYDPPEHWDGAMWTRRFWTCGTIRRNRWGLSPAGSNPAAPAAPRRPPAPARRSVTG